MSAEKLPDVWSVRDYPVLREACRRIDLGESAQMWDLEKATGLSPQEVSQAIAALRRRGYVTGVDARGAGLAGITAVSGDAYPVVGLHPDPAQDLSDMLVERLLAAADQVPDEVEKSRLRRAAELLGDVSKSVTAGVVSGIITSGITG